MFTDIDLYSNRLGTGDQKQSDTVASLIKEIDKADLLNSDAEILGNAYEYLIGQFASETGKKAGEFYTPHEVSLLMSEIIAEHLKDRSEIKIYDPCSGSGSLLINIGKSVSKHMDSKDNIKYYAQELKKNTYKYLIKEIHCAMI